LGDVNVMEIVWSGMIGMCMDLWMYELVNDGWSEREWGRRSSFYRPTESTAHLFLFFLLPREHRGDVKRQHNGRGASDEEKDEAAQEKRHQT
jgi:hypothetical protein